MLHWSIADPAEASGDQSQKLAFFDMIYRDIENRIREFISQ
jgi:protein-tyrosine-phosphatase